MTDGNGRRKSSRGGALLNLFDHLRSGFPEDLKKAALLAPGRSPVTYAALLERSGRFAWALNRLGLPQGTPVAVQADKSADLLALYLGVVRAGHVFLPLNPAYTAEETEYLLSDSGAALLVCQPERQEELETVARRVGTPAVETLAEDGKSGSLQRRIVGETPSLPVSKKGSSDPAAILYTSGTTGKPKGAVLTHANLIAMVEALYRFWGWRGDDVLLHALPLFHIHGLFVAATGALRAGASTILLPRFEVDSVLHWLPESTLFMGVPTMYHRLTQDRRLTPELCSRVRLFVSGSAPLSVRDFEEFQRRTGQTILERYGMTETGMLISNPLEGPRKPGSVGVALAGVEVRLVDPATLSDVAPGDVGEIWVRGGNVFSGYLRRPEANAEAFADGWFRTGDLGRGDPDGYYEIVGRARDVVITGGLNVYPAEVEAVLDAIEGVQESAVVGLPDDDLGERVTAVIVRSRPDLAAEELVQAARARLAPYKCPRQVEFMDTLPRNAMGKLDKERLRRRFSPNPLLLDGG